MIRYNVAVENTTGELLAALTSFNKYILCANFSVSRTFLCFSLSALLTICLLQPLTWLSTAYSANVALKDINTNNVIDDNSSL